MITDVEGVFAPLKKQTADLFELSQDGQSLLEFLLLLPFLLGLSILVIRANQAIQISIVNQQYSRAQAHFLTFNSPVFPDNRDGRRDKMTVGGVNAITMGVGEKAIQGGEDGENQPEAPVQMVARSQQKAGTKPEAQSFSDRSGWVRVFNTVTLCSGSHSFASQGSFVSMKKITEGVTPGSFNFCREAIQ